MSRRPYPFLNWSFMMYLSFILCHIELTRSVGSMNLAAALGNTCSSTDTPGSKLACGWGTWCSALERQKPGSTTQKQTHFQTEASDTSYGPNWIKPTVPIDRVSLKMQFTTDCDLGGKQKDDVSKERADKDWDMLPITWQCDRLKHFLCSVVKMATVDE